MVGENSRHRHLVDQSRCSAISNRKSALQKTDRSTTSFDEDVNRSVEHWIAFIGINFATFARIPMARTLPRIMSGTLYSKQTSLEAWSRNILQEVDHLAGFVVGDKRALASSKFATARWSHHHHVALTQEQFCALLVEHNSTVHTTCDFESDSARHVRLDQSCHNIRLRSLCGKHQVDANRARLLSDAHDVRFDFLVGQHKVRQLVDHKDHIWQFLGDSCLCSVVNGVQLGENCLFSKRVVTQNVANSGRSEEFVSLFHLADGPFQNSRCVIHVRHDWSHQVGDVRKLTHLDHLRIDQDQLQFIWSLGIDPTHDDAVHADGLSRSSCSRDQHVRHAGQVQNQWLAGTVFAQEHWQAHSFGVSAGHQFSQANFFLLTIWHFDSDRGLAGHIWNDANVWSAERARDVLGNRFQTSDASSRCELYRIERDDWTTFNSNNFTIELICPQSFCQHSSLLAHETFHTRREIFLGLFQKVKRWKFVSGVIHFARNVFVACKHFGNARHSHRHARNSFSKILRTQRRARCFDFFLRFFFICDFR